MFARPANIFCGAVTARHETPLLTEITLDLGDGQQLVAVVATESLANLGDGPGTSLCGIVKPTDIVVAKSDGPRRYSARNRFEGHIAAITPRGVAMEIEGRLADDTPLHAVMTGASVAALDLRVGDAVTFLFKALSVILVDG